MKGFTHFVSGLAITSFFPWAIDAASNGNATYFLLGGTLALLPDTLDFRLLRYFYRHDVEITPDPLRPDMQMVAEAIAHSIDATATKPLRIRLNTIRIAPDCWQKYHVRIDPHQCQVTAWLAERIDTGGNPIENTPNPKPNTATAAFLQPVAMEYLTAFPVEIFDGPHLECKRNTRNEIQIGFIPWHRRHTHSLCISAALAFLAATAFGWLAAPVVFAAHASHVMLDQIGYLGSNLLWPINTKRFPGFKLRHASSAFWNLAAVWIALALLYANLHAHSPDVSPIPPLGFIICTIAIPLAILHRWLPHSN